MKVTLDLTELLREGAITPAEHDRLLRLGRHNAGLALVNVLVGFGVIAVTAGCVALVPSAPAGALIGAVLMAAGIALKVSAEDGWAILANICIALAALLGGTGIVLLTQGVISPDNPAGDPVMSLSAALLLVAALLGACAVPARSALLAMGATVVLFGALGNSGSYEYATYELVVRQPLATVVAFSALGFGAFAASRVLSGEAARLLTVVARTSLFLVNLGFWVGSLWGDELRWWPRAPSLSAPAFAVAWALALAAVGTWAGLAGRRWVLNLVVVFAAIHLYTQWFEHLGANPGSVLEGGLVLLGIAVALWRVNRQAAPVAA